MSTSAPSTLPPPSLPAAIYETFAYLDAWKGKLDEARVAHALERISARDAAALATGVPASLDTYTRLPIHAGEGYLAFLLAWQPGQQTAIHDHGEAFGVLRVLRGTLRERSFVPRTIELVEATQASIHPAHTIQLARVGMIHEIGCARTASEAVVSLNIYAPHLDSMRRYTEVRELR